MKTSFKKSFAMLLSICVVMSSALIPAAGIDEAAGDEVKAEYIGTDAFEPIEQAATRSPSNVITFTDLDVSYGKFSNDTYYIESGKDKLVIESLSWSPSGQDISVGFTNVQGEGTYVIGCSGGAVADKVISTANMPSGEYYVCVINYNGPEPVTGSLTFSWK